MSGMSMKTSKAIRELRGAMKLSQEQFAHELGTTARTVSRWEQGAEPAQGNLAGLIATAEKVGHTDLAAYFTKLKQKAVSESVANLMSPRTARRIPYAELQNIREVVEMIRSELTAGELDTAQLRLGYVNDWLNSWLGVTGTLRSKRK